MILPRETNKGRKRYGVRVDLDGKQVWIGTFNTRDEAKLAEAKALTEGRKTAPMTVNAYAEHWLEGYRDRNKLSSYVNTRATVQKFLDKFGRRKIASITPVEAEAWARENNWRVPPVKTLMQSAVKQRVIPFNPFEGLGTKGPGRKHIVPLTETELQAICATAMRVHGSYGPQMRSLLIFLAYTTVRPGEAYALEWGDVDMKNQRVHIRRRILRGDVDTPKSGKSRTIFLPPQARDALLSLPRGEHVFLAKTGGQLTASTAAPYWRAVRDSFTEKLPAEHWLSQRLRVDETDKLDLYELRHFGAHHMFVTLGLRDFQVAEQMGHNDGGKLVRETYGHPSHGAIAAVAAAFEGHATIHRLHVAEE